MPRPAAEGLRQGPGGPALPHPVRRDGGGAPRPRAVRLDEEGDRAVLRGQVPQDRAAAQRDLRRPAHARAPGKVPRAEERPGGEALRQAAGQHRRGRRGGGGLARQDRAVHGRHHDAPVRGGEGGKAHPRGGPAGHAARSRPRHLSLPHLLLAPCGLRLGRGGSAAVVDHEGRGGDQGLLELRRGRAVRHGALRRRGRAAAKARRVRGGVRGDHGQAASGGVVRLRGHLLRLQGPGRHGGGAHQPRRAGLQGVHPRVHGLLHRGHGNRPASPSRACSMGRGPCTRSSPGGRRTSAPSAPSTGFPRTRADYVHFIEERICAPITWISVGPNREQTIRKEARS